MPSEINEGTTSSMEITLEEMRDILIAISVVARRLAKKINENSELMEGEKECTNITD